MLLISVGLLLVGVGMWGRKKTDGSPALRGNKADSAEPHVSDQKSSTVLV